MNGCGGVLYFFFFLYMDWNISTIINVLIICVDRKMKIEVHDDLWSTKEKQECG